MTETRMHITQGQHAASGEANVVITTLLGSCVACCLWDPNARVGGMNHMLLTVRQDANLTDNLVGVNAMEVLINALIKSGAQRSSLRAKAFGGARMVDGLSDIGEANAQFTLDFLASEGITCEGHSFGGTNARNIRFWPATGRVLQRMSTDRVIEPKAIVHAPPEGNDLELF
ncbi:chemotaxis protein CheD [Pseudosulfitobacter pseudonitzschiae]|uniref:chemotaxis protein CheD n=1 Tax=Pseudosulfitobacter pseudonitzschiae TaxID=1402135 RepID=UPI001AF29B97|nr:chemotaxis protein CheD [Pseudosulfitobacter pseudonitzschiae]MBM1814733.1 chemotaxis protein CheD [Pseudosulfitobacter pseudonitzschiae]MBM1831727.1 chemotaxis protein CheD [Pseudosulfitobacter pseudonitzschiae]MBM1836592.1 chemotaxis protein CheD [Pseudosulfitobacter pseudonitzschiae]MBM1841439.1 chemotaxis protein CheD [Pseudosulfitobacter pseudonitzschiae]MBM1846306.1 chemotaxis protein CheD [Pseudosulfitobacter pseudonitzschiae]